MKIMLRFAFLTRKYGGSEIKFEDQEYKILNSSDILAVIA